MPSGKAGEEAADLYSKALALNAVEEVENDFKWLLDAHKTTPLFAQVR